MLKFRPTIDELSNALHDPTKRKIIVADEDDIFIYQKLVERHKMLAVKVYASGGRSNLLHLYKRRGEFAYVPGIFVADREMGLFSGIPEGYEDIIWTNGYSLKNDVYVEAQLEHLLEPHETWRHGQVLNAITEWFAFEVEEALAGKSTQVDSLNLNQIVLPGQIQLNEDFLKRRGFRPPNSKLVQQIRAEYQFKLPGKFLFQILARFLNARGRNFRFNINVPSLYRVAFSMLESYPLLDGLMKQVKKKLPSHYYFLDVGGDSILFSDKGKNLVGIKGCSRFFILGLLEVPDLDILHLQLRKVEELMNSPTFKEVPYKRRKVFDSDPNDVSPEVRRKVFAILRSTEGLRFFAVVADKLSFLEYVRQRSRRELTYHYHPKKFEELCAYPIECLFRERLKQESGCDIVFPYGLKIVRAQFNEQFNVTRQPFWQISTDRPGKKDELRAEKRAGLQVVSYFVWALQRLYEHGDEEYITALWPAFRCVHDIDDTREKESGMYYRQGHPLNAKALMWRKR